MLPTKKLNFLNAPGRKKEGVRENRVKKVTLGKKKKKGGKSRRLFLQKGGPLDVVS